MSSPPVVQALLESFTRCFNPIGNEEGNCGAPNVAPRTPRSDGRSSPIERLQEAFRDSMHRRTGSQSSKSSKSSNGSKKSQGSDDVSSKAKKKSPPSPESLEEKSYKRKLEIFRSRDSPDIERQMNHPANGRPAKLSNDLLDESMESDEEIKNLTSSNRFTCGVNMGPINRAKPVANLAKFFNLGQEGGSPNPFGLCFATPVRAASPEDIATLSDDKLTTDEFLERHRRSPSGAPDLLKDDSLEGSDSTSSDDDVETVESTLYFESKYNHFLQIKPPMPLFHAQSIPVSPSKTDELAETIRRRSEESISSSSRKKGSRSKKRLAPRKKSRAKEPYSPTSVADMPKIAEF